MLVIGDDVAGQLQPYHEFECTGTDDQYVQEVDITKELQGRMAESKADDKLADALEYFDLEERTATCREELMLGDQEPHKYGYAIVRDGVLIKAVQRTNPNKKWDWWVEGGRWSGLLRRKDGLEVDTALKGHVDFEAMRAEKEAKARALHRRVHAIVGGREIPSWDAIRDKAGDDMARARAEYGNNPVIMDLRACEAIDFFNDPATFACTEDEYAARARRGAIATFAVVMNSKWYEKGSMGWWACVSNEKEPDDWNKEFDIILDSVADDIRLTVVDAHI